MGGVKVVAVGGEGRRLKEMLVSCNLILSVVTVASE